MYRFTTISILTGIIFLGCRTAPQAEQRSQSTTVAVTATDAMASDESIYENTAPPGQARIHGRIISIIETLEKNAPDSPCSKVPCRAMVLIDSVISYGSGYGRVLGLGEIIEVNFAFTLSPTTKELFPNLDNFYPGLKEGSKFIANLEARPAISSNESNERFIIYDYNVK